jgi:hypothetical protein
VLAYGVFNATIARNDIDPTFSFLPEIDSWTNTRGESLTGGTLVMFRVKQMQHAEVHSPISIHNSIICCFKFVTNIFLYFKGLLSMEGSLVKVIKLTGKKSKRKIEITSDNEEPSADIELARCIETKAPTNDGDAVDSISFQDSTQSSKKKKRREARE